MEILNRDLISILISVLCGSILGFEREYQNKSAGFRTIILICLGSTLFTIVSQNMAGSDDRIAANIITGVGFIGAGVIFKNSWDVKGLTTAAVIWVAAAIGMLIGINQYLLGIFLALMVLFILSMFSKIEDLLEHINHRVEYSITFINNDLQNLEKVEQIISEHHLKFRRKCISRENNRLSVTLVVSGNKNRAKELIEILVKMDEIWQI